VRGTEFPQCLGVSGAGEELAGVRDRPAGHDDVDPVGGGDDIGQGGALAHHVGQPLGVPEGTGGQVQVDQGHAGSASRGCGGQFPGQVGGLGIDPADGDDVLARTCGQIGQALAEQLSHVVQSGSGEHRVVGEFPQVLGAADLVIEEGPQEQVEESDQQADGNADHCPGECPHGGGGTRLGGHLDGTDSQLHARVGGQRVVIDGRPELVADGVHDGGDALLRAAQRRGEHQRLVGGADVEGLLQLLGGHGRIHGLARGGQHPR
jgi:hypothetical protein